MKILVGFGAMKTVWASDKKTADFSTVVFVVVAQAGLEPATHGFSVRCYYQLSYRAN